MSAPVQRVLLLEDNPGDVFLFEECVREAHAAVEVAVAGEVEEGIRLLEQWDPPLPCLVLVDLHLPRNDGKHLLSFLRTRDDLAAIPAVVLSSSNRPADREACLQLGAREFFTKPSDWAGYRSLVASLVPYWSMFAPHG